MIRSLIRLLFKALYRFTIFNAEATKTPGPVLLVPNHVSWLDWIFVAVCVDEDWKFVTSSVAAKSSWVHRLIMVNRYTFPIDINSPYAVKRMAEFLQKGGRLVLFAEGRITLTGNLMKLFDGTGFLLHRTGAKVITCYLRGAERIPFVRHRGWTQWFPKVEVHFSKPLFPPDCAGLPTSDAREKLTDWLGRRMIDQQFQVSLDHGPATALEGVVEMARIVPTRVILEDMSRQTLNYRRIVVGARLLACAMRPHVADATEGRVGVLLPNVNATPVTLLALWSLGKTPAILNYSAGAHTMAVCGQIAGLKVVVTSRKFIERAELDLSPFAEQKTKFIYLEDLRAGISSTARLLALLRQTLFPARRLGCSTVDPKASAVILFTSGSEGTPKAVELAHRNLMANVRQMLSVIDIEDHDRLFNCLPLFHSFGLSVGLLLPLMRGIYVFLYPSPLHYRVVPEAVYDRACTILLATNTFLAGYARKANPYDFRTVRYLFAGAEKLQEHVATTWARTFGVRILEGYGATECSPCVSVNTPMDPRFGSAGRVLPGIETRLEPVPGIEAGGRLLVRGPNIMKRYLNEDADQKFQALDGWYDTGDIVTLDEQNFIYIQGRAKRFAKVSGEMVSLTMVEETLNHALSSYGPKFELAILTRPDEQKGEALIAVTTEPKLTLTEIRAALRERGVSNLAAPRDLHHVKEIPKLGSGKTDYRTLEADISTR